MTEAPSEITTNEESFDSRMAEERLRYLENLDDARDELEQDEYEKLVALRDQFWSDTQWKDGTILVRDTYFEEFAQEEAESLYHMPEHWPFDCIDWKQAAEELKQDYFQVEFDGVTYWARAN